MKVSKIRKMETFFHVMVLLMLFACKKTENNEATNNNAGRSCSDVVKGIEEFKPEYDACLFPIDFERLGLKNMVSLTEVIEKVPEKILLKTTKLSINMSSVKSLKGIERFANLQYLELYNLELNDLMEISLHKSLEWLTIHNFVIKGMKGLSNLQKLYLLNFNGSKIVNWEGFAIPESLKILSLNKFVQYQKVLERMPSTVEQLYLEENGITSLSEIEYLKDMKNLKALYIKDNCIPQEELMENTPYWGEIELIWFES